MFASGTTTGIFGAGAPDIEKGIDVKSGPEETSSLSTRTQAIRVVANSISLSPPIPDSASHGDCDNGVELGIQKKKKGKLKDNKIHVQNERTFLSWFSAGVGLLFIGVSLLRIGYKSTNGFATCVMIYSFAILFYATWQYYRRQNAFLNNLHADDFQYHDRVGPLLLVVGFCITICVGLVLDFAADGVIQLSSN